MHCIGCAIAEVVGYQLHYRGPGSVPDQSVGFVADSGTQEWVFLQMLLFSHVSIVPPTLYTYSLIDLSLTCNLSN
jgi:hypothetical protein